ncbi:hypothetical protein L9F63_020501, partial [Diploptera punctata]
MKNGIPTDVGGYFGSIWTALGYKMNFSTSFLRPFNGWGRGFSHGYWSGLVGAIVRHEADVGLASLTITNKRTKVVDFVFPLMDGT